MNLIFILGSAFLSVSIVYKTLQLMEKELEKGLTKNAWTDKAWKVLPWNLLGIALGIFASIKLFNPIFDFINNLFNKITGQSALSGALLGIGLIFFVFADLSIFLIKLLKIESKINKFFIWIFFSIISVSYVLFIYELSVSTMDYVLTVCATITAVILIFTVKYWQLIVKEKSVNFIGYGFLLTQIFLIRWYLIGESAHQNFIGTLACITPVVILHVGFLVINFVLVGEKTPREMLSYKLIYTGVVICTVIIGLITVLQFMGYINKYELEATRAINYARSAKTEIDRRISFGTDRNGTSFREAQKKLKKAIENENIAGIEIAKASLEEHYNGLSKIQDAEFEHILPRGLSKLRKDVWGLLAYISPLNWGSDEPSDEEKIATEDGYYVQAQGITIHAPAEIKTPEERQKAIASLSKKVDLLAKACQHNTGRYDVEYQKWLERLGFERAL
ncbi:hypothetical protein KAI65_06520, partial [Candidatus Parcubacteria bacterium]|nr:hypothetical protein [Candidatus Parcubacteria bacterium]